MLTYRISPEFRGGVYLIINNTGTKSKIKDDLELLQVLHFCDVPPIDFSHFSPDRCLSVHTCSMTAAIPLSYSSLYPCEVPGSL